VQSRPHAIELNSLPTTNSISSKTSPTQTLSFLYSEGVVAKIWGVAQRSLNKVMMFFLRGENDDPIGEIIDPFSSLPLRQFIQNIQSQEPLPTYIESTIFGRRGSSPAVSTFSWNGKESMRTLCHQIIG
jgi:hypothetical protein